MKDNRVLIDTSVWINYFKDGDRKFAEKVDEVLTFSAVYVPRVVLAELIQGAKSEKEISVIEEFVGAFKIIDQTEGTWLKAGKLSFSMKKKGITVNIVDCYIAVIANENNCMIFSLDEHFKSIKKFLRLEMFV
ncbi:MAG TPA: PIN domain-containing protein [Thermodesulfovibrionia bacterium]|nr:PIN domain-containing protein [Thermodesulfovibrionia bacterium]